MNCVMCGTNLKSSLSPQEEMAAKMFGIGTAGYKCDRCGQQVCTACFTKNAAAAGATSMTHGNCGGTFKAS